jgi:hypothetical protein
MWLQDALRGRVAWSVGRTGVGIPVGDFLISRHFRTSYGAPLHLNGQSSRSVAYTSDLHVAPRLKLSGGYLCCLFTASVGQLLPLTFTGIVSLDDLMC